MAVLNGVGTGTEAPIVHLPSLTEVDDDDF